MKESIVNKIGIYDSIIGMGRNVGYGVAFIYHLPGLCPPLSEEESSFFFLLVSIF